MDANAMPTLLGGQTQIDIRAIERELSELWKSAAEKTDGGLRGAVTRTCVLNLVAVARSGRASQEVTETVDRLTGMYPNRAIVVSVAGEVASQSVPLLDAWVQAHCQIPVPGRPQVCCEQITIEAHGDGIARVPGTILPLLVPDVPVVLWYPRGEPFADTLFNRVGELADRVLLDSSTFANPQSGLQYLAAQAGTHPPIGDLNWGRLTPWRELVAQCFDAPQLLQQLNQITNITIEYFADTPGAQIQALLLLGWLASRLDWQPGETEPDGINGVLTLIHAGSEVTVELRAVERKYQLPGHLMSITITCRHANFVVARAEQPDSMVTRSEIEGRPPILRTVRRQYLEPADLIAAELRLPARDLSYESALQHAALLSA